MKSFAKKTRVTPSIWKSYLASGDTVVYLMLEKSMVEPSPVTGFPGTNLRLSGLGVGFVLIKRLRIKAILNILPVALGLKRSEVGRIDRYSEVCLNKKLFNIFDLFY